MGKDAMYRWEDLETLKHHCGVCDKPLSHPSAKSSCFGTHAEPCHRFHQVLFMPNRGHTCDVCSQIDENHYKRHREFCEHIRKVYEACGEDWPIAPEIEEVRGRSDLRHSDDIGSPERSSPSGELHLHLKRKDRKEQKRQSKSATRAKVVTQDDVNYAQSVLHPVADDDYTEKPSPINPEEIDEIEQQLRCNAMIYSQDQKKAATGQSPRISDADIDFRCEIDRVFEQFRISELVKRNERNRGLQNKDLANFKTLIASLRDLLINDLIQAKRDQLEVRMRRAGFFRYTSRSRYDIVVDRYGGRDFRTGEKFRSVSSMSSDGLTAVDDEIEPEESDDDDLRKLSTATLTEGDKRHIDRSYTKVGRNGFREQIAAGEEIENPPKQGAPKPPPSLRIVNTDPVVPQKISWRQPWKTSKGKASASKPQSDYPVPDEDDGWQTVGPTSKPPSTKHAQPVPRLANKVFTSKKAAASSSSSNPTASRLKPMRAGVSSWSWKDPNEASGRNDKKVKSKEREERGKKLAPEAELQVQHQESNVLLFEAVHEPEIDDLREKFAQQTDFCKRSSEKNGSDQEPLPQRTGGVSKAKELPVSDEVAEPSTTNEAAVGSKKKKNKKKREMERKARRAAEQDAEASQVVDTPVVELEEDCAATESVEDNLFVAGPEDSSARNSAVPGTNFRKATVEDYDSGDEGAESFEDVSDEGEEMFLWLEPVEQVEKETKLPEKVSDQPKLVEVATLTSGPNTGPTRQIPIVKTRRHGDWKKFADFTKLDGLSPPQFDPKHPVFRDRLDCWYLHDCPFEASDTPDCPYHKPYCDCVDPLNKLNFQVIVYPGADLRFIGEFNYLRAHKLMRFFETQPETRGRVMLVDSSLFAWISECGRTWNIDDLYSGSVPTMPWAMQKEVEDYKKGYTKGRLLKQIDAFKQLGDQNEHRVHNLRCVSDLSQDTFHALRKKCEKSPVDKTICYCQGEKPAHPEQDQNLITCVGWRCPMRFFHKSCTAKLGVNRLTKWYCAYCDDMMRDAGFYAVSKTAGWLRGH